MQLKAINIGDPRQLVSIGLVIELIEQLAITPYIDNISTTDAIPTTLQILNIPNNTINTLTTTITYRKTGGSGTGITGTGTTIILNTSVQNINGVLTLDVIQNNYTGNINSIGTENVNYIINRTDILVQVTGITSDNINWIASTVINSIN